MHTKPRLIKVSAPNTKTENPVLGYPGAWRIGYPGIFGAFSELADVSGKAEVGFARVYFMMPNEVEKAKFLMGAVKNFTHLAAWCKDSKFAVLENFAKEDVTIWKHVPLSELVKAMYILCKDDLVDLVKNPVVKKVSMHFRDLKAMIEGNGSPDAEDTKNVLKGLLAEMFHDKMGTAIDVDVTAKGQELASTVNFSEAQKSKLRKIVQAHTGKMKALPGPITSKLLALIEKFEENTPSSLTDADSQGSAMSDGAAAAAAGSLATTDAAGSQATTDAAGSTATDGEEAASQSDIVSVGDKVRTVAHKHKEKFDGMLGQVLAVKTHLYRIKILEGPATGTTKDFAKNMVKRFDSEKKPEACVLTKSCTSIFEIPRLVSTSSFSFDSSSPWILFSACHSTCFFDVTRIVSGHLATRFWAYGLVISRSIISKGVFSPGLSLVAKALCETQEDKTALAAELFGEIL